jgi:hypothetical protein
MPFLGEQLPTDTKPFLARNSLRTLYYGRGAHFQLNRLRYHYPNSNVEFES